MTMALLLWVLVGIAVALIYFPFFYSIETALIGKPWGLLVAYLATFFLWPGLLLLLVLQRTRSGDS